jgi:hypothetical protein
MVNSENTRKFKANPIEVAILFVITLIFFNSVYNLFYNHNGFHPAALIPMTANPVSEGRSLASVSQNLMTWDIKCDKSLEKDTSSNKIRLNGILCGSDPALGATKLLKANIINSANQYNATVFSDVNENKFSTDYIPLETGKNAIRVEFTYIDGKSSVQDLSITKN